MISKKKGFHKIKPHSHWLGKQFLIVSYANKLLSKKVLFLGRMRFWTIDSLQNNWNTEDIQQNLARMMHVLEKTITKATFVNNRWPSLMTKLQVTGNKFDSHTQCGRGEMFLVLQVTWPRSQMVMWLGRWRVLKRWANEVSWTIVLLSRDEMRNFWVVGCG